MTIAIYLEYKSDVALYRRLSDALRKAILEGRLKLGQSMPSIRELSESIKLSRSTILKAYADLQNQGLVVALSGSGTFVSTTLPGDLSELIGSALSSPSDRSGSFNEATLSERGQTLVKVGRKQTNEHVHVPAIEYGGTPIELSPMRDWKTLLIKHCNVSSEERVAEMIEPLGLPRLREAIAAYVLRRRSIASGAQNVCIFGSKQLRLELIGRLLLDAEDVVAYEEPGYPENRHTLESMGATIAPIEIDSEGLSMSALQALPSPPKLIYISPSHQDPLGYVMSMRRRHELLDYAATTGAFIIEDDFDNEFRYGKPILPSLKAIDPYDCVIYIASFWKVLYQSLRLSYAVFPDCLVNIGALGKGYLERHLPLVEQLALTDFINDGFMEKHVKCTQRVLEVRRQALILAITRYLKNLIGPLTDGGGTHLILNFNPGITSSLIERTARESGFTLMSTRPYYMNETADGQFIVPFARVDKYTINDTVSRFADLLQKALWSSSDDN